VPETSKSYVADATATISEVAFSTNGAVEFFVQFADLDNANFKLIIEKGLKVIPVASREILRIKLNGQTVCRPTRLCPSHKVAQGQTLCSGDPITHWSWISDGLPQSGLGSPANASSAVKWSRTRALESATKRINLAYICVPQNVARYTLTRSVSSRSSLHAVGCRRTDYQVDVGIWHIALICSAAEFDGYRSHHRHQASRTKHVAV
jgi:hypothetical protein